MILFIDDEKRSMKSFVDELRLAGYKVSFQTNVEDALVVLDTQLNRIDLVVLDIMMPYGTFAPDETEFGLRTGVRLFERLRQMSPDCPVLVFSNVTDESIADRFHNENNCSFLQKEDNLPFELAEKVREILLLS